MSHVFIARALTDNLITHIPANAFAAWSSLAFLYVAMLEYVHTCLSTES